MGFTQGCGASELLMFVVGRGGMGENIWFNPEPPGLVVCSGRAYGGEGDPEPNILAPDVQLPPRHGLQTLEERRGLLAGADR